MFAPFDMTRSNDVANAWARYVVKAPCPHFRLVPCVMSQCTWCLFEAFIKAANDMMPPKGEVCQ